MKGIHYRRGDATAPVGIGNKLIAHVCNDIGAWGRGFVLAVSRKWSLPEKEYRRWYKSFDQFELGRIQVVQVESEIYVVNMIGQHGIYHDAKGNPPVRYEAIDLALRWVCIEAQMKNASVHMPRIGCGLAGGSWQNMEEIINARIIENGIDVYVYDLE